MARHCHPQVGVKVVAADEDCFVRLEDCKTGARSPAAARQEDSIVRAHSQSTRPASAQQ